MRKKIKISIWILIILVVSNVFSGWIHFFTGGEFYNFETFDNKFKFRFSFIKGGNIYSVKWRFRTLELEYPEYEGTQLYRTFSKNPLRFWDWYNYFTAERYRFPYKKSQRRQYNNCR